FAASRSVRSQEWNNYLESIRFAREGIGTFDFGYAVRVTAATRASHEQEGKLRRADYQIYPVGEQEEFFPVIYLRDVREGDQGAVGWDASSEPHRREAMEKARDTGEPVITSLIELVQPNTREKRSGYVLYLPVYGNEVVPDSVLKRRESLSGFVFASFVPEDFWSSIFANTKDMKIRFSIAALQPDGTTRSEYSNLPEAASAKAPVFLTTYDLSRFGRTWVVQASTLPSFHTDSDKALPWMVLAACFGLSTTMFGIAWTQARARSRAVQMSDELRRSETALRNSELRFRRLADNARDIVYRFKLRPTPHVDYVSPSIQSITGHSPEEFYEDPLLITRLILTEDINLLPFNFTDPAISDAPLSFRLCKRDGSIAWIETRHTPVLNDSQEIIAFEGIARDVTDKRTTEEALRQSEERLTRIVDTIADGVLILDMNGKVTFANAAAERIFGHHQADEALPLQRRWDIRDRQTGFCSALISLAKLLRVDNPRQGLQYSIKRPDGSSGIIAVNAARMADDRCQAIGIVASIRDVTAEKRTEQVLIDSQTRLTMLNSILAVMAAGIPVEEIIIRTINQLAIYFPSHRVVYSTLDTSCILQVTASAGSQDLPPITGNRYCLVTATEYISSIRRREVIVIPDTSTDARVSFLAEQAGSQAVRATLDLPVRHSSSLIGLLSFHCAEPHAWEEHEITTLKEVVEYLGIAHKQAEADQERKRAEMALEAEKERLGVTLSSIADGVIATDLHGTILLMNGVAETITGWSQAEALHRNIGEVFPTLDDRTRQQLSNPVMRVLQRPEHNEATQHVILLCRNDQERLVTESAAPIRDHDGKLIGAVLVFRDITQKRKIETELVKASKLESVGLLAGGIAHDFNNILSIILGNVTLAKMISPDGSQIFDRLTQAEKGCLRAKDLTQQLLTFAKGGAPIRKAISIIELVKDSTGFAMRGSNVNCQTIAPPDLWAVDVDEGQISQVINNLVINAVQAMPDGGTIHIAMENVEVESESRLPLKQGRYVMLSVKDTGVGISPQHLGRIFDPYFTTKQTGSGLGLATAYSIVQKHEGYITVESKLGLGTTFYLYLPATTEVSIVNNSSSRKAAPRGHGRILVMDDEQAILDLARATLGHLGYEVEVARDGNEAIQLYSETYRTVNRFAAVIMDLTVPGGMGGREAMKRLREIDPLVKGIVSSGYSQDPVMANFREHGFLGVVDKPYEVSLLAQTLHNVIKMELASAS
ncbi:MAG: PAS domain S-box protein, partial [Verrucomicrobiota bacterium]|nr:PAS domain S-box protein [Verrucomicrobiota bacterium]